MVGELGPARREELRRFLSARPEANLPLVFALEEGRGTFLGAQDEEGALSGVALVEDDGLAYLATQDPRAARALGRALRSWKIETFLADAETADIAWNAMVRAWPRLILNQAIYSVTTETLAPTGAPLPLRPARGEELPQVQTIARAMFWEEVGLPPSIPVLDAHLREELEEGSLWVLEEDGQVIFLARVAARCSAGAEVQRVYTAPERRRRGIATAALGTLCQSLVGDLPRVVLRVNEKNRGAMRLYCKLGFSRCSRIRLYCR